MDCVTSLGSNEFCLTKLELDAYRAEARTDIRSLAVQSCEVSKESSRPPSTLQKRLTFADPLRNFFVTR